MMNRSPLWLTFTLLMAALLLILTLLLSYSNYRWGTDNAIRRQNEAASQLIRLKLQNLDQYFSELSDFCVLPVYDAEFYNDLLSSSPLDETRVSELQKKVGLYFYSRTDLLSYQISMFHQNLRIGRSASDQRMKTSREEFSSDDPAYQECLLSPLHYAVFPSDSQNALLSFSHTIIRISDGKPIALVTIDVNKSIMSSGFDGQLIALFNQDGQFLYTNAPGTMREDLRQVLPAKVLSSQSSEEGSILTVAGAKYLLVSGSDASSGMTLAALTPLSSITGELHAIQLFSFLQGLVFLLIALLLSFLLIRYLTAPLSALAGFQGQVGSGQYPKISIGRCRETAELGRSFNDMSEHIDRLVNDNLIASLNEKNARIEALEAQVNPHFLYNTLQAIGSEALMNDEPELYDMITRLASNMRYSINGSNEVSLSQELRFTDNYIELQKLRMDERLQVTRRIDHALLNLLVPKCSLQLIVENSIKYGLTGDISRLHLEMDVFRQADTLVIRVRDDGAGMSPERLDEVLGQLRSYRPGDTAGSPGTLSESSSPLKGTGPEDSGADSSRREKTAFEAEPDCPAGNVSRVKPFPGDKEKKSGPSSGIGLLNLYSRLKIMYDNRADIQIESSCRSEDHFTCVTLLLQPDFLQDPGAGIPAESKK